MSVPTIQPRFALRHLAGGVAMFCLAAGFHCTQFAGLDPLSVGEVKTDAEDTEVANFDVATDGTSDTTGDTTDVADSIAEVADVLLDTAPSSTLEIQVVGLGTVESTKPSGILCGTKGKLCRVDFSPATNVVLLGKPDEGQVFVGFKRAECALPVARYCNLSLPTAPIVIAVFEPLGPGRTIFVSSQNYRGSVGFSGGAEKCQAMANTAGLPNAANYRALLLSKTLRDVWSLMGGSTTLRRIDGRVVVRGKAALDLGAIEHPVVFTELGDKVPADSFVRTGATRSGLFDESRGDCLGWTSDSSSLSEGAVGEASGGPTSFLAKQRTPSCAGSYRLYCVDTTATGTREDSALIFPTGDNIRRVFLSSALPEPATPAAGDKACALDAIAAKLPASDKSGAYKALIARKVSGSWLSAWVGVGGPTFADMRLVRTDGVDFGASSEFVMGFPRTGIWTDAFGKAVFREPAAANVGVGTGGSRPNATPTDDVSTCSAWSNKTSTPIVMGDFDSRFNFWTGFASACSSLGRVYCIQTM